MKKFAEIRRAAAVFAAAVLLAGCGTAGVYDDGAVAMKYDSGLVSLTKQEGEDDIFAVPKDGKGGSFVDCTATSAQYGKYSDILKYMQQVYLYNAGLTSADAKNVSEKETSCTVGDTDYPETQLSYTYTISGKETAVESRAVSFGDKGTFVAVYKNCGDSDQKTEEALASAYGSAHPSDTVLKALASESASSGASAETGKTAE